MSKNALGEGLSLETRDGKGRCVFAQRSFLPGTTVLGGLPYQAVLHQDQLPLRCSWCLEAASNGSLLRCSRSKLTWYCSKEHQRLDWKDGFQLECAALERCKPRVPPPTVRLVARVLWKHLREQNADGSMCYWDSFAAVEDLVHHWEDLPDGRKPIFAEMACLAREYVFGDSAAEEGMPVKHIALLLARFACNNHTICDEELRPIGIGMYPSMCMVNHSCTPNCVQVFKGRKLLFRALHPISPGEEITITYIDQMATRHERREQLLQSYHFDIDRGAVPLTDYKEYVVNENAKLHAYGAVKSPFPFDSVDFKLTAVRVGKREQANDGGVHISCQSWSSNELSDSSEGECTVVSVWGSWYECLDEKGLCKFGEELAQLHRSLHNSEEFSRCGNLCHGVRALEQVYNRSRGELVPNISLGVNHIFLSRIESTLLKMSIDGGQRWDLALEVARELSRMLELVLSKASPPLGLHLALLAKLEALCGDPRNSLSAATRALDILRVTHSDLKVFEEVRRIAYDAECILESHGG